MARARCASAVRPHLSGGDHLEHSLQNKPRWRRPALLAFGISALAALALFLPFLIIDKGFFLYCGDFNSQQIPFYQYCQQFVKSGGGAFSWATDLGSGFLNTYSFYNLGSPFFWLSCLLPNRWLPYAMVPLLCLKFGVGGLGAYLYMRRYTKSANFALVGSALFTLSGWGVYNIFFNHFKWTMKEFATVKGTGSYPLHFHHQEHGKRVSDHSRCAGTLNPRRHSEPGGEAAA